MSEPKEKLPEAFWRHYSLLGRWGMTLATMPILWALIAICMALVGLMLVLITAMYPLMHIIWGMQPPDVPRDDSAS